MIRKILALIALSCSSFAQAPNQDPCWNLQLDDKLIQAPLVHECPFGEVPNVSVLISCRSNYLPQLAASQAAWELEKAAREAAWLITRAQRQADYEACVAAGGTICITHTQLLCMDKSNAESSFKLFTHAKNLWRRAMINYFTNCMLSNNACVNQPWPVCGVNPGDKIPLTEDSPPRINTTGWAEFDIFSEGVCWDTFESDRADAIILQHEYNSNAYAQYQYTSAMALDRLAIDGDCLAFKLLMSLSYDIYKATHNALQTSLDLRIASLHGVYILCAIP